MTWPWFDGHPFVGAATWILLGLCLALIASIFVGRAVRLRLQRRANQVFEAVQSDVYALLDEASDAESRGRLIALSPRRWRRIEFRVLELIESLRGESVTGFVEALAPRRLVDQSRADLRSRRIRRRLRGAHRVGALRLVDCLADIERAVADPQPDVSAAAIRALGRIGHASSAAAVFGAIGAGREGLAVSALTALCATDASALLPQLSAESPDVRRVAATVVGEAQAQALGAMVARLAVDDPSVAVRRAAVTALGTLANPEHFDAVAAATRDVDHSVRRAALTAVGQLGDVRGLPILIAAQDWPGDLPEVAADASLAAGTSWVRQLAASRPPQTFGPVAAAVATAHLRAGGR